MRRWVPVGVFVVGLAILVTAVTITVSRGPFDRTPVSSERFYWEGAVRAASGTLVAAQLAGAPSPLYPHLLSPLASSQRGAMRRARRILAAILLPLAALGVFVLARKRTGPWLATAAGLAAAACGPLVWNAGSFSPAFPAAVAGLIALVVLDRKRTPAGWFLAGLFAGLVGRLDPALGWSLGILLLLLAWARPLGSPGSARGARLLAMSLFAVAWLGASWASARAVGTGGLTPPVPGIKMFQGHRAGASGVQPRRGDHDPRRWWSVAEYTLEASRRSGNPLRASQANGYWSLRALAETISHPIAQFRQTGVKFLATYQGDPAPRDVSCAFVVRHSDGKALPIVIWIGRILLPLGLAGLVLRARRVGGVLWAGALSGFVASWLTYAGPDSRQLTVALLAVGLALFLDALVRGTNRTRLAAVGGGIAAVALWGIWPAYGGVPGQGITGDDFFQLGSLYDREGRGSAAMSQYERATRRDPTDPYPRLGLAMMLARDNVLEEAARELEALRRDHPAFLPGLRLLAQVSEHQKRWARAASVYGELVRLNPYNAEFFNNLATMYVKMGYYEQAEAALKTALRLQPKYRVAQQNLDGLRARGLVPGTANEADPFVAAQDRIVTLIRDGNSAAAQDSLDAALRRFGTNRPELVALEATLRLSEGKAAEAIRLFESVRDEIKDNPLLLNNLAAAYAQAGDREQARDTWKKALELQPDNEPIRRSLRQVEAEIDSLATVGKDTNRR